MKEGLNSIEAILHLEKNVIIIVTIKFRKSSRGASSIHRVIIHS